MKVLKKVVNLQDTTDVKGLFDTAWNAINEGVDDEHMPLVFEGFDICLECFHSTDITIESFKASSYEYQTGLLRIMDILKLDAVRDGYLMQVNGMTMFTMWMVSVIKKQPETTAYIESCLAQKRTELNIPTTSGVLND